MRRRTFLLTASSLVLATTMPAISQQSTFDPTALAALKGKIEASIAKGDMPGAVWLLAKGDEVIVDTSGNTAYEGGVPMRRDTIFRIASVGKAVGTAAVMMLVEDGKLTLDEPVDRLLPELANRQVLRDLKGPITDTVPATRAILVRDLMNARSASACCSTPPCRSSRPSTGASWSTASQCRRPRGRRTSGWRSSPNCL